MGHDRRRHPLAAACRSSSNSLEFPGFFYNSWTYDLQPQGRYLFAAIIPLGLLFGGTINYEGRWVRTIRAAAWVLLSLLSLYVLWQFAVLNPALRN